MRSAENSCYYLLDNPPSKGQISSRKNFDLQITEQRIQRRFVMPEGVVAVPKGSDIHIGRVMNLSIGGMGLRHSLNDPAVFALDAEVKIDIMVVGGDYHLSDIPAEIIWVQFF